MGMMIESYGYGPGPMTASAAEQAKELQGVFCSSSSSGTLAVFDGTTNAGAPVVAIFNLVAGTFYRLPFRTLSGSVYLQIGGTANIVPAVG